uniref:Si:dkey-19b23.14 n=1 Tax=Cyprinus carpio TaxID=7962 RepID=A0A8C1KHJ8_CYPCA
NVDLIMYSRKYLQKENLFCCLNFTDIKIFNSSKMFSLFIAGSVWIYSVHPPSYDPTNGQNYCNKTLYLFAFWLNTVCYGCLAVLLLCSGFSMLYICLKSTCQRPQPLASNSQQHV